MSCSHCKRDSIKMFVQRHSKEEARRTPEDGLARVSLAQAAPGADGAHAAVPQAS